MKQESNRFMKTLMLKMPRKRERLRKRIKIMKIENKVLFQASSSTTPTQNYHLLMTHRAKPKLKLELILLTVVLRLKYHLRENIMK